MTVNFQNIVIRKIAMNGVYQNRYQAFESINVIQLVNIFASIHLIQTSNFWVAKFPIVFSFLVSYLVKKNTFFFFFLLLHTTVFILFCVKRFHNRFNTKKFKYYTNYKLWNLSIKIQLVVEYKTKPTSKLYNDSIELNHSNITV